MCFSSVLLAGTAEPIFKWGVGALENERWRREFVLEGSGGILPQKILKSGGSEMV